MSDLIEALSRPAAYPHHPRRVELRETHISWVFLAGKLAYKLKKPVVLDFVDYGTAERRHRMCEEEVRLNRRLAPDVYLGVRGVRLVDGRAELTEANDRHAVDFLVEMRRYDERQTLAARLDRGELTKAQLMAVATTLVRFHRAAPPVLEAVPGTVVSERFERNIRELLTVLDQRHEREVALGLERFAHAFIRNHAEVFDARAAAGSTREGHGDLRAEHVLIDESVQIVDCVEFDRELRTLDVGDELAFLLLDLASHGSERLGRELVEAYRDSGGDPGEDSLIAFYAVHRALVRAKVAGIRAAQVDSGSAEHCHQSARARELISLGLRFAWRARAPIVIIVCGVPGSGKSGLAAALGELSGFPHLSSDVTRKRLAGLSPNQRAPAGAYSAEWNLRTYAELARLADEALATGGGAIVDATFRHRVDRQAFAESLNSEHPLLFIECTAPPPVLAERAARRDLDARRTSDAGEDVVARERLSWEPLDEVPAAAHVIVRTDRPLEPIVDELLSLLDRRLEELGSTG